MIVLLIGVILFLGVFIGLSLYQDDYNNLLFKIRPRSFLSIFILIVAIIIGGIKSVPTGHTGIITTFGKVEDNTLEAGIHFINPISNVIKIDNRTQKETIEMGAFSSDIQEVSVVYTVNYAINKTNAQILYRTVGLKYFDTVIQPKVVENVKRTMAKYTAENLVSSRAEVAAAIETDLKTDLEKFNIELVATSIENLDFTDAFTDAVEAKQVAEQNKLKAQTEADTKVINAQAAAEVQLIEAKAAAEANELLTKSLTKEILEQRAIEHWNGELPMVVSDGSNILDLTGLPVSE